MDYVKFDDADKRARAIVSKMTLKEKIDFIGGCKGFYVRGYAHHGIPEIKMADGPVGVRNYGKATAFPSIIALASSWNEELSGRMGIALADECRATGVHMLLAPGVNIHRLPQCGRNFEYLGEDPFLASRLAVPYIKGLQENGVLATVKHFAANNQEWERNKTDSVIDERTLREIYYPAFKAAVQEGDVGSVMNAYNLLNGEHCSQNRKLLVETLKDEWGFKGFVVSDWVSTYDTKKAVDGGLDLEMPRGDLMSRQRIMPLLQNGDIAEEQIDDKVLRIIRTCIRMGFYDRPQLDVNKRSDAPETRETALEIARQGCVLLKNDGLLPLDFNSRKNIVVTGPNGHPHVVGGGGSSQTTPFSSTSILEALQKTAGDNVEIKHIPIATEGRVSSFANPGVFETTAPNGVRVPGLSAQYYSGFHLRSIPVMERIDESLDFEWTPGKGPCAQLDCRMFCVKWSGFINPTESGDHQLAFEGEGGLRVWIDDEMVIDDWRSTGPAFRQAMLELEEGREYKIEIVLFRSGLNASIRASLLFIDWAELEKADAVIACMGFNDITEKEHRDRAFELPEDQRSFMDRLMKMNTNVALVGNAGGAFDVSEWIDDIPAFLHQWFSGQSGGTAVAEILTGKTNPSGKLPISYGKNIQDYPGQDEYPGRHLKAEYKEGIFVGYRHFDARSIEPLFPFGHGLSYTTFEYGQMDMQDKCDISGDEEFTVALDVTNKGELDGAEVVQVYVSFPESDVKRPVKELKAFKRIEIAAGATGRLEIPLRIDSLKYYDAESGEWRLDAGEYIIAVGSSSRDIRQKKPMILEK